MVTGKKKSWECSNAIIFEKQIFSVGPLIMILNWF